MMAAMAGNAVAVLVAALIALPARVAELEGWLQGECGVGSVLAVAGTADSIQTVIARAGPGFS
jgi:hypothetical protein